MPTFTHASVDCALKELPLSPIPVRLPRFWKRPTPPLPHREQSASSQPRQGCMCQLPLGTRTHGPATLPTRENRRRRRRRKRQKRPAMNAQKTGNPTQYGLRGALSPTFYGCLETRSVVGNLSSERALRVSDLRARPAVLWCWRAHGASLRQAVLTEWLRGRTRPPRNISKPWLCSAGARLRAKIISLKLMKKKTKHQAASRLVGFRPYETVLDWSSLVHCGLPQ